MKASTVPSAGWIRVLREQAGISSYEMARRAGVSQPTIMNWEKRERDGTITLATLRRAGAALESDFNYALIPNKQPASIKKFQKKKSMGFPARPAALVTARQGRAVDPNDIWGG